MGARPGRPSPGPTRRRRRPPGPPPPSPRRTSSAAAPSGPVSRGERWRSRLTGNRHRRRGALAGAAVGLVLAGGLGGLALGHATADEVTGFTERGQVGSPFGHDDEADHHGFPGGTPPQGSRATSPGSRPAGSATTAAATSAVTTTGPTRSPARPSPAPRHDHPARAPRARAPDAGPGGERPLDRPGPARRRRPPGRRLGAVAEPAAGHLLVDRRRRDPDLDRLDDRADLARSPHRPGRLGAAARAGPADGADPGAGEVPSARTGWPRSTGSSASRRST